jgi:hypothetical protein
MVQAISELIANRFGQNSVTITRPSGGALPKTVRCLTQQMHLPYAGHLTWARKNTIYHAAIRNLPVPKGEQDHRNAADSKVRAGNYKPHTKVVSRQVPVFALYGATPWFSVRAAPKPMAKASAEVVWGQNTGSDLLTVGR